MLDVVVANPNAAVLSPFAAIEPPLWAGLIANDLQQKGERVAILDAEAMGWTSEETVAQIKELNPKRVIIVAMGSNPSASSTPKMPITKKLVSQLDFPVEVTGLHPSALPQETSEELGVAVLPGKIFEQTPDMPWDMLPMHLYRAHFWHCLDGSARQPYGVVYTSLGCPFSCSFCNIHALYGGHQVWYRNPIAVVQEIDTLVNNFGIRNIKFWDELFTLNQNHVEEICNLLIGRNYDLNIWAYARTDRVNPRLLALMKRVGINWLAYGFEGCRDADLIQINKKTTIQNAKDAVKITHEEGINIIGNFLFGLPGDEQTLEFAQSLELEFVNFYEIKPYPGSALYNQEKWHNYSQFPPSTIRDRAFNAFFTDPIYLNRIGKKFGQQAVESIDAMIKLGKPSIYTE